MVRSARRTPFLSLSLSPFIYIYLYILWHVDPLLGNDREISNCKTAAIVGSGVFCGSVQRLYLENQNTAKSVHR
jgi:hypothetical protein